MSATKRQGSSSTELFSTAEISRKLGISRVTISKKIKQLNLDLKREKFRLEVVRYRWSKKHIKKLIESLKGAARRQDYLDKAIDKGLIDV